MESHVLARRSLANYSYSVLRLIDWSIYSKVLNSETLSGGDCDVVNFYFFLVLSTFIYASKVVKVEFICDYLAEQII